MKIKLGRIKMSETRIQKMVNNCGDCPYCTYRSVGMNVCGAAGNMRIFDKDKIASFCPLPLYPSQQLADLEELVSALRKHVSQLS